MPSTLPNATYTTKFDRGSFSFTKVTQIATTGEANVTVDVPVSTTNQAVAFAVVANKIAGFFMQSTGGNLTVKTNSSGSPDQTFNLVAGAEPIDWNSSEPNASNPVTTTITELFVTNASSTVPATLIIYCQLAVE